MREQIAAVDAVLTEIGGDELPIGLVLNKVDGSTHSGAAASRTGSPMRCRCRR